MKKYPSIPKQLYNGIYIYAFQKFDGSNIRVEWNPKKGFYKWGTRKQMIDQNSKPFGSCIKLISEKFENDINKILTASKYKEAVCFFEYFAPSSFAGRHDFSETFDAKLIDVSPYKKGILSPKEFLEKFGELDIAKPCYEGFVTDEFIDSVKNSTLKDMPEEGVVCKGVDRQELIMFKIKSNNWINKLKNYCNGNEELFDLLY
jgi:hypothetical protein